MFTTLFSNVALMLVYMFLGFIICKTKKAVVSHAKSFSALLVYILAPCMLINSFLQLEYTPENAIEIGKFFLVTLLTQLLFFIVLYILLKRKFSDARYRIMSIGGVLGNVGYLGMPMLVGMFPDNPMVLCYSSINVMSMNLIVFTVGVFLITNDKKYISVKNAFINPTMLSILFAMPLFFFKIKFPVIIGDSIEFLGKMVTPMCMFILGMRLSAAKLKSVFSRAFVYITALLKLVIFPVFSFLLVSPLPFMSDVAKASVVVLAAAPAGAIIASLAELHECEQELAANVVFVTTILSVITIPLVTTILL